MKLDRIDVDILYHLHQIKSGEQKSISSIAKEIFDVDSRRKLKSKDALVRSRLSKLLNYGLVVEVDDVSPTSYYLNDNKVIFGDITIDIKACFSEKPEQFEFPMEKMFFVQKDKGLDVYGYLPDKSGESDDPRGIYDELEVYDGSDEASDLMIEDVDLTDKA